MMISGRVLDFHRQEGVPDHIRAWPRAVAGGIFAVVALVILTTFQDYGISWDEQLQNTYGQKLLAYYVSGFADTSAFSYSNLFLYGGFFDLLAAIVNLVSPFDEYATRHLIGGLIFLGGLWGGWRLARLLAGERAALLALIALVTTPLLYGHGFINPKDSPLAWLLIWTTYFCCRILGGARPSWGVLAGFAVSFGLAVGTRVIGVVYLNYLIAVGAAAAVARVYAGERLQDLFIRLKPNMPRFAAALLGALAVMALVWPWSVHAPFNVFHALQAFSRFAFYPQVLWNGELIRADAMPWSYLPGLLAMQLPEYVLFGLGAAMIAGGAALWRSPIKLFATPRAQQYLFVALSMIAPLAGYMLLKPTVYNGLRHFLFIVPPAVILGAIGLEKALVFASRHYQLAGPLLSVPLVMLFALQIATMTGLHPYQYIAYNALIGGTRGAENRFELDYWGTSLAESARGLARYLQEHPEAKPASGEPLRVFACGDRTSAIHFLPPGTVLTEVLAEADYYLGMTGVPCRHDHDQSPRTIFEVVRFGVTVGYVLDISDHPPATQRSPYKMR
jgi:hypothetical protein